MPKNNFESFLHTLGIPSLTVAGRNLDGEPGNPKTGALKYLFQPFLSFGVNRIDLTASAFRQFPPNVFNQCQFLGVKDISGKIRGTSQLEPHSPLRVAVPPGRVERSYAEGMLRVE